MCSKAPSAAGNAEVEKHYRDAIENAGIWAPLSMHPSTTRRSAEAAALLYDGPWVAERLAAVEDFMATNEAVRSTVRAIIKGAEGAERPSKPSMAAPARGPAPPDRSQMGQADILLLPYRAHHLYGRRHAGRSSGSIRISAATCSSTCSVRCAVPAGFDSADHPL